MSLTRNGPLAATVCETASATATTAVAKAVNERREVRIRVPTWRQLLAQRLFPAGSEAYRQFPLQVVARRTRFARAEACGPRLSCISFEQVPLTAGSYKPMWCETQKTC